jgi:hypothetical protein
MRLAVVVAGCMILLSHPIAQAQTLTACENNKTHKVTNFAVGGSCKSNDTTLTLNVIGPTGPQGPAGPTGATGPAGANGSGGGPSLDLEGTGMLVPTDSQCNTLDNMCTGTLTASLGGSDTLNLSLFINDTMLPDIASEICFAVEGSGTLNAATVAFEGRLCLLDFQYTLTGTLSPLFTFSSSSNCQSAPITVMVGQLNAYGAVSTIGPTFPQPGSNPILIGMGGAIVNVIGSQGQIPSPCPQP